jgi:thioester reductase-like protein
MSGQLDRLTGMACDLSRERFGLDERVYSRLAEQVDMVIHAAAAVNFLYPYDALKGANVEATREVVRFCLSGKPKRLGYVSTVSVFDDGDHVQPERMWESAADVEPPGSLAAMHKASGSPRPS